MARKPLQDGSPQNEPPKDGHGDADGYSDEDSVHEEMFFAQDPEEIEKTDVNVERGHEAERKLDAYFPSRESAAMPDPALGADSMTGAMNEGIPDAGMGQRSGQGDPGHDRQHKHTTPAMETPPFGHGSRQQEPIFANTPPAGEPRQGTILLPLIRKITRRSLMIGGIGLGVMILLIVFGSGLPLRIESVLPFGITPEAGISGMTAPPPPDNARTGGRVSDLWHDDRGDRVHMPEPDMAGRVQPETWHIEFTPGPISSGIPRVMSDAESDHALQTFSSLTGGLSGSAASSTESRSSDEFRGYDMSPVTPVPMQGHGPTIMDVGGSAGADRGPDVTNAGVTHPDAAMALMRMMENSAQDVRRIRELLELAMLPPIVISDAAEAGSDGQGDESVEPITGPDITVGAPFDGPDAAGEATATTNDALHLEDADTEVGTGAHPVLLTSDHATINVGDRVRGYGTVLEIHEAKSGRILIFE
ncbi:MAG: hypothetical protein OXC91_11120 [Rhodobacteraceae bacterium]|nr:hypothetical protein [Paracoccaceae bacterium]